MGTLASGSIDLKSLKVAGSGATSYITTINGGGIQVHDAGDSNNYIQLTSNGMEIYKGDTANSNKIASFGSNIRLGPTNATNMLIEPNYLSFYKNDGTLSGQLSVFNTTYTDGAKLSLESAKDDGPEQAFLTCQTIPASGNRVSMTSAQLRVRGPEKTNSNYNESLLSVKADGCGYTLREIGINITTYVTATLTANQFVLSNQSSAKNVVTINTQTGHTSVGSLNINNHNTNVGYSNSGSGSQNVEPASSPYVPVPLIANGITLYPGTFILIGEVTFGSNSTGLRHIEWYDNNGTILSSRVTIPAASSGVATRLQSTVILDINNNDNSTETVYLRCYHTGSQTLTVNYYWHFIRIT